MNDIRLQLPECPLAYEVPPIPGNHTALVIPVNAADINWQEKMLPWTLASLINNTDIVMQGVHLYIACEHKNDEDRIQTALKSIDLPKYDAPMNIEIAAPFIVFGQHGARYDSICLWDINYWAFRGQTRAGNPEIKLPLGHILRHNYGWGVADYSIHPANGIGLKGNWIPTLHLKRTKSEAKVSSQPVGCKDTSLPSDLDSPKSRERKLANYFMDAGNRARFLHDANRAVYGENYEKRGKTVAGYFFNETEPNWHLNTSILQYPAVDLIGQRIPEWFTEWRHLGTDALLALWLLKTGQHAYNLRDSLMIEDESYVTAEYPKLFDMQYAPPPVYRDALKQLMGAQLAMKI